MATKVICPCCHAEFLISEHEHTVQNATVIGQDSNLGVIELPLANGGAPVVGVIPAHNCSASATSDVETPVARKTRAQTRLEALQRAGVDTSAYNALNTGDDNGILVRSVDGNRVIVEDDDPVIRGILAAGSVPARELFRRWIPSQTLAALSYHSSWSGKSGYTEWLKSHGYEYSFKVALNELAYRAACSSHGDHKNYQYASMSFNKKLVKKMVAHYMELLRLYVDGLPERKCRRRKYKKVRGFGKGVFVNEIEKKVFEPLKKASTAINRATTPGATYEAFKEFCSKRIVFPYNTQMCPEFVNAYKLNGAYYTMRDLIMFEGCVYPGLDRDASLVRLETEANGFSAEGCGYKMLGVLKKFLEDNGIDPEAKRQQWHQQSLDRRAAKAQL